MAQVVKNLLGMQETTSNAGDTGSIPGSGRSPGEGNGNPLQYSCLEDSIDRGAWRATYSPWDRKESDTTEQPTPLYLLRASQVALVVKNLPASAGDIRDMG